MFRNNILLSLCALCVSFFSFLSASAQEVDSLSYLLDDIVAVGKKTVAQDNSATPFQRFSSSDIERLALGNVADAVKRMSGVDVHDYGGVGGLKTVSVRGLGAKHTAVSYDGVVVSDAQSGMVDVGRFALDNISSLSLTIGQDDEIALRPARDYSLATLLSMKSNDIQQGYDAWGKVQGGSFGFGNLSLYGAYGNSEKTFAASFRTNYMRSDGAYPFTLVNGDNTSREKRRDSDVESCVLEGNLKADFSKGVLSAKLYYYASQRGLPGAVNLYNKENRERLWNRNFFAQASYEIPLSDALDMRVVAKYDYNFSRYKEVNKNYAAGEQVDVNRQNEGYISLAMANSRWKRFNFSVAMDFSYASLRNNFENGRSPRRISSYSVFAMQYFWGRASLTASLLATYINDDVRIGAESAPYRRFSPALSFSVKPFASSSLRLRASFKDSYRVPTFPDLYYLTTGDGPENIKEAVAYFDAPLRWFKIPHHGNACTQSNTAACKAAGAVLAWYNGLEPQGPGTTAFTQYGTRRCVQAGLMVWDTIGEISGRADAGRLTLEHNGTSYVEDIPYKKGGAKVPNLNGPDVSSFQAGIDFKKLAGDFGIVKATQGLTYINPYWEAQIRSLEESGKLLGLYHYAGGNDATKEAEFFVRVVKGYIKKAILVLDWESYQNKAFNKNMVAWCKAWLDRVYELTGVRPLIYMSQSVTNSYDWSSVAKDYGLWVARYPDMNKTGYKETYAYGKVGAWKYPAIYQYTSSGQLNGWDGRLDLNIAYMDKTAWGKYADPGVVQEAEVEAMNEPKPEPVETRTVTVTLPVCKLGSEGMAVRLIEAALGAETEGVETTTTGVFNDELDAKVKAFQTAHSLTVDGIVGGAT